MGGEGVSLCHCISGYLERLPREMFLRKQTQSHFNTNSLSILIIYCLNPIFLKEVRIEISDPGNAKNANELRGSLTCNIARESRP